MVTMISNTLYVRIGSLPACGKHLYEPHQLTKERNLDPLKRVLSRDVLLKCLYQAGKIDNCV